MIVLAHRANREGAGTIEENTLPAVCGCLELGYGIEIDIRRDAGGSFYISHEQACLQAGNHADSFFAAIRQHPGITVALNVKELGYEAKLLEYLSRQQVTAQVFLFDMELLEQQCGQTARLLRQLVPDIRLAARVSDRQEPVARAVSDDSTDSIWLDEFDNQWVTEADIRRLKSTGKAVFAVSPEIHGFTLQDMRRRWRQFYSWGVDGICTDYATSLSDNITTWNREDR